MVYITITVVVATTISTVFLAWYVPDFVSYYVPAVISDRQTVRTDSGIDPLLDKYLQERTVTMYQKSNSAETTVLTAANRIGQGILLSTDGWIATVIDPQVLQNSSVLDAEGKVYTIDTTVVDTTSGITYGKISGGNFLVASIFNWEQPILGTTVYVLDTVHLHASVVDTRSVLQSPGKFMLHVPYSSVALTENNGSIVFDSSGAVVGFVVNNVLVPSWYITHGLSAILANTDIKQVRPGYIGSVIEAYKDPVTGVFIESPAIQIVAVPQVTSATLDTVQVGDIITAIDTQSVHLDTFARTWSTAEPVSVRILRDTEYRTIEL
jgi:hypothetical protein